MAAEFQRIIAVKGTIATGAVGCVCVHWQKNSPVVGEVQALRRAFQRVVEEHPLGVGFLFVADHTRGSDVIPGPDARRELKELVRDFDRISKAGAVVVIRDGFLGAAIRGVATSVLQVSARGPTMRVVAGLQEGAEHVLGALPEAATNVPALRELLEGLEALRRLCA